MEYLKSGNIMFYVITGINVSPVGSHGTFQSKRIQASLDHDIAADLFS